MSQSTGQRLESWKEIASYLGRDQRTAMRWETLGMPVHREPGAKRGRVFAYREEIDAWMASQPATFPKEIPGPLRRPTLRAGVALVAVLTVLVAGAVFISLQRGRATQPERVSFEGDRVVAWDARGRRLWEYSFPMPLHKTLPVGLGDLSTLTRIVDLFGDGRREVLVVAPFVTGAGPEDPTRAELYCFSERGKVLWHYQPEETFRFGGQEYGGPWQIYDLLVSPEGKPNTICLAVEHHIWWPSFVVHVDPTTGKGTVKFVNSGSLYALHIVRNATGTYLLAGGFNNEYDAGSLAVLDVRQAFAASPQSSGSPYKCESCPVGSPARYFLFPRSELNVLENVDLNFVQMIRVRERQADVSTREVSRASCGRYVFSYDSEILPQSVSFDDGYMRLHRKLEADGKLKHSWEQCTDRLHPKPLRMWTPQNGWSEVPLLKGGAN